MSPFTFARSARAPRTALLIAAIWALLLAATIFINAAWWLMALLALTTLPALYDLVTNRQSGLTLTDHAITWHSGPREGRTELPEIDRLRLDTRWDLSIRATILLKTGKKIRLPYESLPPHRTLEAEAKTRGLTVERHHFSVF